MQTNELRRGPRMAQAIHDAALRLLVERGYDGLTIEGIASRSGVNKTTIYRWWPSKDAVLAAALTASDALALAIPDTGSLRGDLRALARRIAELVTDPATAPIAGALLAAGADRPQLAVVAREFFADRLLQERAMLDRASERGEVAAAVDPRSLMDLLAGAIWFRVFVRGEAPTEADLDAVVDTVLYGLDGRAEVG
ncbi:TetR family transcriptional regulator [Agromyces sp. CFH 90414]|uniref:TetR family transcriptional regulator n=1 Tax=Agromyces agglutinans TaxID=2662258 RepID=A0A6I2F9G8_9MICO|nr:TetR/AcrR family transcriptional regulator [Agromyces agglutinans]MRG61289.1 TetR family transcriptional regulator [Agromyces agglutinans]